MSDLLTLGAVGLTAYQNALAAVGDNVANAETPGYARRRSCCARGAARADRAPLYRENMNFSGVEAASASDAPGTTFAPPTRAYAASAAGRADVRQQWLGCGRDHARRRAGGRRHADGRLLQCRPSRSPRRLGQARPHRHADGARQRGAGDRHHRGRRWRGCRTVSPRRSRSTSTDSTATSRRWSRSTRR